MRRMLRILTAGASLAGGLAAVGSIPGPEAGAVAAPPRPIVVGGVWTEATYAGADIGAEAAFRAFNAAGGLGGRPIKFIGMLDDGQSPAQDLTAAQTLVANGVFAVAPVLSQAWRAASYLQARHVAYFGWGTSQLWSGSTNGFSIVGVNSLKPPAPLVRPVVPVACMAVRGGCGGRTVALLGASDPTDGATVHQLASEYETAGARIVYQSTAAPSAPADYTRYAKAVLSADRGKEPNIVQQVLPQADDLVLVQTLRELGFRGTEFDSSTYDPRAAAISTGGDTIVNFAPFEQHSPMITTILQQVKAFNPHASLNQSVLAGYFSALELIQALKGAGPGVTPGSLIGTLNKGWTFGVPGAICPVTFPAAHYSALGGAAVVHSTGTSYALAVPLRCPAPITNPLAKP